MAQQVATYGSWRSPITSELIVQRGVGFGQTQIADGQPHWLENRPQEGGRSVVVRHAGGGARDLVPWGYNARTMVHEYGGGSYLALPGTLYFTNFEDQRVYRLDEGSDPRPITAAGAVRYADFAADPDRGRLICVREDHREEGRQATNCLVALSMEGDLYGTVLAQDRDFYATPRLSPDGRMLAWLEWDHPNMPWDGTELRVAPILPDGSLGRSQLVAGGADESIFQPTWSPDGVLHFASDRTGFWNLYAWRDGAIAALHPMAAEFGRPQWQFAMTTFAFSGRGRLVCCYERDGVSHLAVLDEAKGTFAEIPLPYTVIGSLSASGEQALFLAASPTERGAVVSLDLGSGRLSVLRQGSAESVDEGYISSPEAIAFPTGEGETAHAFYYPPKNRDYTGPAGSRPPLIVMSHGGPTGSTSSSLDLQVQYWTSRGFAVVDVNYRGSAGYGRAYRDRLKGNWGLVDVEDCEKAALHLVARDKADPARIAVRGASAGGYTTLAALSTRDTFKAGASLFGIGDLAIFAGDTHKFESRYMDSLVGPYPQAEQVYRERSPIHHLEGFNAPCIFFQGLDDKIVPPNQAELMVQALRQKGVPVAHLTYLGEGHGFRKAENIQRTLDAELYFYSRVFGFTLPEPVRPVPIENLDG